MEARREQRESVCVYWAKRGHGCRKAWNKGSDDEGIRGEIYTMRWHEQIWMVGWRWGGWELKTSDQILIREHQAIKQ